MSIDPVSLSTASAAGLFPLLLWFALLFGALLLWFAVVWFCE